ncbi:MAG: helix-turn-helix transcriptional regulator [Rhizobiaceae bacterium]|nr:helix-turn-helix transcriptional regulator [Rhizobiaceae bacterium]
MELKRLIGRRIKTLRELRGLTQGDLAERLDRSVDAVSMIERGKNWPSSTTLEAMRLAMDVSVSELFDDLSAEEPTSSTDQIAVARHLLSKLGQRDLDVAVAMLEKMAANSSGIATD